VTSGARAGPKLGVILPLFTGDHGKALDAARESEALGFDGVFAFDHFFPPGGRPDRPSLEAFTTLAAVASATTGVVLGTLVTRAVLRPPGLVAKMASTIDLMSGGRMILGVGTGDPIDRPEHVAFGFPDLGPRDRRDHVAEWAAAVRALFRGETFGGGRHVPPIEGPLLPAPATPGGPSIWLGGLSDAVVRLAARLADGWNGWGLPPDRFGAKARLLAEEAERTGGRADATWAGIVLVGETRDEVSLLLEERRRKGMDDLAFAGDPDDLVSFLLDLSRARATWAVLLLAGPSGRRELVAERVLPNLSAS
jgi:alkanesulfonate monooxygenase SsuD/methylene tetrahydromethanopterin reductase-like flavin-dependent oxidoreductase (luciferase family)